MPQFESLGDVKRPCLCGAKNCSGQIGVKPKGEEDDDDAADAPAAKAKKSAKVKELRDYTYWKLTGYTTFNRLQIV